MKTHFKNVLAIIALIAVVYIVSTYAGWIQQQIGVKGISTSRAQEIGGQITTDVGEQLDNAREQVLQVKVEDVINGLSRFQRIPRDVTTVSTYVQEQYNSMVQSKDKRNRSKGQR